MIQDKIFFDEKDPTGVSYNTPFTVYGSYEGRLWSKTPTGSIKFYTQNSDLSVYATTGSNSFNGNQTVTGSLTVTGQVVAQTLNVQQVTSSIVYSSGSNIFGNSLANTQQFTGSLQVSGSSHYVLGNVGVGITTPSASLHVVRANDGGSGTPAVILSTSNGANDIVRFQDGTTPVAVVKNDGSIGIGTASPAFKLDIEGTSPIARVSDPNTSGVNRGGGFRAQTNTSTGDFLSIANNANAPFNSNDGVYIMNRTSGSNLHFTTNNAGTEAERMRITSGGNTEVRSGNILNIYRTDNTRALQLYTTINECVIDSWAATSEPLMLRSNGTGGRIVFHTNGAERARITANGLTFNGDTAAANALDDYEEGTWTPTLPNGGTISVVSDTSATYTKIGRKVTVSAYIDFSSIPNNSSNFHIGGLPFTIGALTINPYGAGSISYSGNAVTSDLGGPLGSPSSSILYFHFLTGTSSVLQNTTVVSKSLSLLIFTYTYFVS
jgi:hypothetical protein